MVETYYISIRKARGLDELVCRRDGDIGRNERNNRRKREREISERAKGRDKQKDEEHRNKKSQARHYTTKMFKN